MATIAGIIEGKTGDYFKLDNLGEDAFIITESIDPEKTEIRTEKVPNKNKKKDDSPDELTYYHIRGRLGEVEKDLSVTFTALQQLAGLLPRKENWQGYMFKYNGTKGTGKNIKYQYAILGKAAPGTQTQFVPPQPVDAAGKLVAMLKTCPAGLMDTPFWDEVKKVTDNLGDGVRLVDRLKQEGRIYNQGGYWKAT